MRNNNKAITADIAKKEYASDKGRRIILTAAAGFAVMTLFCVFSLALGKIETDMLRDARQRGTVVNTTLERATQEQYEQIQKLPYIKAVGTYIRFGSALDANCAVIDEVAWEKIKKPAFTDIHGTYPDQKMEIMLPKRELDLLGISEPQIGMELPVTIEFQDKTQAEYNFILSGYYTEYIATLMYGPPDIYFSGEFLDEVIEKEDQNTTLLLKQNDRLTGRNVERMLYSDIRMRDDSQQFLGGNTMTWQAFYQMSGGFGPAWMLAAVILISAGLLIYNVLYISFEKHVQKYGLLKALGTTKKQLYDIVFRQVLRMALWGSLFGAVAGTIITLFGIPALLSKMYLYRFGSAAGMITFHPVLLLAAVLFGGAAACFSSALAIRRTVELSPMEAIHYMGRADGITWQKERMANHKKPRVLLLQMAWRNILRFKKRFLISALCLTLGIVVSMGVIVISKGADTTNQIEYDYFDCSVMTMIPTDFIHDYYKEDIFPESFLRKLESLPEAAHSIVARGGYGEILVEEEALALNNKEALDTDWYFYRAPIVIQELNDAYLKELKEIAQKEGLYLDVDTVLSGEGVILMHDHILSPAQIEQSKDTVGMPLGIYALEDSKKTTDMTFCGYLDWEQEGLPDFSKKCGGTWRGGNTIYLITSKKGFQNTKLRERIFAINITAKEGCRTLLDQKVRQLVGEYNSQFVSEDIYEASYNSWLWLEFTSKIDMLDLMGDYIRSNRLIMGAICAVLLLMGLANYVNVTVTGLIVRIKEFAVMESVGLTGTQLKKLLILEGMLYSCMIIALSILIGGSILLLGGWYIRTKMEYFVFRYPIVEFAVCAAGLFTSCTLIVLVLYRRYGEGSIAARLRIYAD